MQKGKGAFGPDDIAFAGLKSCASSIKTFKCKKSNWERICKVFN